MKLLFIKKTIFKFIIMLSVCIALSGGPVVANEVSKMLEALTEADKNLKEVDEKGEVPEELVSVRRN